MVFTLTPAKGDGFIDREELMDEILKTLSNKNIRMDFALYGIRRVGKTSIFKELHRRLKKRKDIVPVYVSLWNIAPKTVYSFTKSLTVEVLKAYGPAVSLRYKVSKLLESPSSILRDILSEKISGLSAGKASYRQRG